MRARITMVSGLAYEVEETAAGGALVWLPFDAAAFVENLKRAGATLVRDALTGRELWLMHAHVESVGEPGSVADIIDRETERRINERVAQEMPRRVPKEKP